MHKPIFSLRYIYVISTVALLTFSLVGCESVSQVAQVDPGVYEIAASGKAWRDAAPNLQVDALRKADAFCRDKGLLVHVLGQSSTTGVSGSVAAVNGFDNSRAAATAASAYRGPFGSAAGAAAAESSRSAGMFGGFVHHGIPSTAMVRFSCVASTDQP